MGNNRLEEYKTIKQLADFVGTTKNKVAYQVRKVTDDNIEIVNGIKYLNKIAQEQIINAIKQLESDTEEEFNTFKHENIQSNNTEMELLKQQIEVLQAQLERLDEQLSTKDAQINQLHTIIATQTQQLGINQIEHAKEQRQSKWWEFWR